MRYWKAELGNGFCGCGENFIFRMEEDGYDPLDDFMDFLAGYYGYFEGAAGITLGTAEEVEREEADIEYEDYNMEMVDNSYVEEITEEEYNQLVEDGWEER